MSKPILYRKRLIPEETVLLKDDEILLLNSDVIVTRWNVLRPRKDFTNGYSCYFLNKGYKVSKFQDNNNKLLYYYCDIIDTEYDINKNTYIFTDLLADIIIYEDGRVKVVDIGEIPEAMEKGLLQIDMLKKLLIRLDDLLNIINSDKFDDLLIHF